MRSSTVAAPWFLALAAGIAVGCSSSHAKNTGGGGTPTSSTATGGAGTGGTSGTGGTTSCGPTLPSVSWTSPYAGWSRGLPSDPSFFPIAVWLQQSFHAAELAQLGVNVYVGNNAGTDPLAASDLATLKTNGIYAIVGQDSVGLANVDDTTIAGWWMNPDEPDNAQPNGSGYGPPLDPSTLVTQYQAYKTMDSTRPIYLGLGQGVAYDGWEGRGSNPPAESGYVPASDIIAFDIYPYNNCGGDTNEQVTCGQFWLNAFGVERLHTWSNRKQAVWTDIETTIIGAGSTAGPTPAQTASEVWLALIHEANGIEYFIDSWNPSFREDAVFENTAMVTALTALNQQIKSLAPVLNSGSLPGVVSVTPATAGVTIDTMTKVKGTTLYVFAAVSQPGSTMASFEIAGMTGGAMATVVGESRTVPITAGAFSDSFAANGVHIYSVDLTTITCP